MCEQCCKKEQVIKENFANTQTKEKQYYDQRHGAASALALAYFFWRRILPEASVRGELDYHWQSHQEEFAQAEEIN